MPCPPHLPAPPPPAVHRLPPAAAGCSLPVARHPLLQEAYQHAQAQEAEASEDAEFPALDWEGWREVAKLLGILDTSDAPMFR